MANEVYTEFLEIPKEYVLVNPTDENIEFSYDGETRVVPSYNRVIKPHTKYSDVPHSAVDESGDYIPGTLLLKDIYGQMDNSLGGKEKEWNAAEAIRHTLGIDTKTGVAHGKYSDRGLSVAPRKYTRSIIEKIKSDGRSRFEGWRLKEANDIINAHDSKNAARQNVGMAQIPGDESYRRAALLVSMHNKKAEKEFAVSMGKIDLNEESTEQGPFRTSMAEGFSSLSPEDKKALLAKMLEDKEATKLLGETHYFRPLKGPSKPVAKPAQEKEEVPTSS